ncbi:MAG: hypothetical protein ACYTG7_10650 [Planctomycetota bacterium]|jgi:hypothetical protein
MRKTGLLVAMVSLFIICNVELTPGKDVVINDCFEMMSLDYWTWEGSPQHMITLFDVTGGGDNSWCHLTIPNDFTDGSLKQQIFVMAGETYTIEADVCYHNC